MITRERLEKHAVGILVAFSGACFAVGLLLQHTGKAINEAVTWVSPR